MYAGLWRALPGPVALRLLLMLVLLAAVLVMCFQWLFPLVASWLPYGNTTVDSDTAATALTAPSSMARLGVGE